MCGEASRLARSGFDAVDDADRWGQDQADADWARIKMMMKTKASGM